MGPTNVALLKLHEADKQLRDAQARLGDTVAAALAFQAVASDRVQSDSTAQMAQDRLEELRARTDLPRTILR